ncbi:hypothetical protein N9N67_09055 [Bacteriovoracaceae bacterium]|nr:hypothetical protein [Bacteriovoracaceae bacterium]
MKLKIEEFTRALLFFSLFISPLSFSSEETASFFKLVKSNSPSLNLKKSAHTNNNQLSLQEIQSRARFVFEKTIGELKLFLKTPLFSQIDPLVCQTKKYMAHLIFDPPFNGGQWVKVLSYERKLSPHQQFKQELCFINENIHRFKSSLLVVDEDDDYCQPGPEGEQNLEYVYGRGNKLLWKIYLCPQALRRIKSHTLDQALRYISLHEVFHLIGLEHFIDRPTDLLPQKLWLLQSLLYRPYKVAKTKIGKRFNKIDRYRFSHIEHIGSVVSDPVVGFEDIGYFLTDQNLIGDIKRGTWGKRVKDYLK